MTTIHVLSIASIHKIRTSLIINNSEKKEREKLEIYLDPELNRDVPNPCTSIISRI